MFPTTATFSTDTDANTDDQRYQALCAHDARFDGRFFDLAAQAEGAGFRPCLRCRPELAPRDRHWSSEDAGAILAQQATALLDDSQTWQVHNTERATMLWRAQRLGVSDRHLRRIFGQRLGVSPLQYLQTRKLPTAKQLLADTALPVSQVALASGFGSLRRFNASMQQRCGLSPS